MTARIAILALLSVLALAPAAAAKGITQAVACGADGCRDVTARSGHGTALMELGEAVGGPTAHGPGFVRLILKIGEPGGDAHATIRQLYVPARDIVATHDDGLGWVWNRAPARMARVTRGIRPLPASRLPVAARRSPPAPSPMVAPAPPRSPAPVDAGSLPWWPLLALAGLAAIALAVRVRRA